MHSSPQSLAITTAKGTLGILQWHHRHFVVSYTHCLPRCTVVYGSWQVFDVISVPPPFSPLEVTEGLAPSAKWRVISVPWAIFNVMPVASAILGQTTSVNPFVSPARYPRVFFRSTSPLGPLPATHSLGITFLIQIHHLSIRT